jgi:hypothetical protein
LKNLNSDSINAMMEKIKAGDSAMLFFTGSRQYNDLKAQTLAFQKTYAGKDISTLTYDERSKMLEDVNALHAATQEYLNYKHDQRGGDLSGAGRRYEKSRIDAARYINEYTEFAAAKLGAANREDDAIKQQRESKQYTYVPVKDRVSKSLASYYDELGKQTKSEVVKELAWELHNNATLLGDYSSKVMNDVEKAKYQDLLTKMVVVNMLTTKQVGPISGKMYDPAKNEAAYTQNKGAFLETVSAMLPKSVSELSINVLATDDHGKQIADITMGVHKNMEKEQISKSLTTYYGQLGKETKSEEVKELAQELYNNANLLSEYSAKVMNKEERGKYQELLAKMVIVNMLTTEQVGLKSGAMLPPAKIEKAYTAQKDSFLKTISRMMPENASKLSIHDLVTGDHRKQITDITQGVRKNMNEAIKDQQKQVVSSEKQIESKGSEMEPKAPVIPAG